MVLIDAIVLKFRDQQVATGPSTQLWVSPSTVNATSWACGVGTGGEGAAFWLRVLSEVEGVYSTTSASSFATGSKALTQAIAAAPRSPARTVARFRGMRAWSPE